MSKYWQIQEAKNRFSEVVDKALREGPQTVTRHGEEAVVIISSDQYKKLLSPKITLAEFFSKSPLKGVELNLERNPDPGRKIKL